MMNIGAYVKEQKRFAPIDVNWNTLFKNGGYYNVELKDLRDWNLVHEWCIRMIGRDHYSWAGEIFWFEDEQHALMFRLCWG